MTTLDELKELFSIGFLENRKAMQELKEEIAATSTALVSRLNALDAHIGIVEKQLDEEIEVTEIQQETVPMCIVSEGETERIDNELADLGAKFAEEINLQHPTERADTLEEDLIAAECVETYEWDLGAAENKVVTPDFVEETSPIDEAPTLSSEQEETPTSDEETHQHQQIKELGNAEGLELCVETENMSLAETCHDSSSAETEDFSLADTEDISLTMENQTRHGFCAEDIIESAAMPRTGPDKPKDHKVSPFDRIVHHDIEDSLARIWSMSKKGNGFPWDDGISRELELVDDLRLDNMNLWVSNLLESYLLDQNKSRLLIGDAGKTAGIPRTGPDIPSFHAFDQSQFLRFAGEGGCITYCDVIGSVTRPPEVLLNVPVPC